MKAIVYARVSSKDQERDGFSIPAQKKLLLEYAKLKGLIIEEVFEEAETAKCAGRKEFERMLEFLHSRSDIHDILVEKTDRLYRNFKDYTRLDVEQMGLRIHLVKEGEIISKESKSHQKFIHGVKVLMAKNYSDNLSEEVRKGQTEKAEQGAWPSVAPLGYLNKLDDHSIILDPNTFPLIRKGFELAATGQYSLSKLKRTLFNHGLRSKRAGKELGKEAMATVLRNPFYYGEFRWSGKSYKGTHHAIIDYDLFARAQEAMGFSQKPKLTKHDFSYAGMLSCAHCGCSIVAERKIKKSGRTYIYYHCTNGKGVCESVTYLREESLEVSFMEALREIRLTSEIVDWTKEALLETSKDEQEYRAVQIKALSVRYRKLDNYISQAYDDKLDGKLELDLWERKTEAWKAEQRQIEGQLQALRAANTSFLHDGMHLIELASKAADLFKSMTNDEKREMLSLVLSNPRVANGSIQYDYKMPFAMFTNVVDLEKWRGRVDEFRTWCNTLAS